MCVSVDNFWNPITSGPLPTVALTAPSTVDVYALMPSTKTMLLSAGVYHAVFTSTVIFRTARHGVDAQRAGERSSATYPQNTSSLFTVVPNVLNRLQVLMPGENADARPSGELARRRWISAGKNGLPDENNNNADGIQAFFAGNLLQRTRCRNGVDAYYNRREHERDDEPRVDGRQWNAQQCFLVDAAMVNGTTNVTVVFKTAQDSAASPVQQQLTATSGILLPGQTPTLDTFNPTRPRNFRFCSDGRNVRAGNFDLGQNRNDQSRLPLASTTPFAFA